MSTKSIPICKAEDDFIFERPYWIAELSDGTRVFQDDGRPGYEEPSAWVRLRSYCLQTGVAVVNLILRFRSHYEAPLLPEATGYYFCHKAYCTQGGPTYLSYIIGFLLNDSDILVQHWKVPELIITDIELRYVAKEPPLRIIKNTGKTTNWTQPSS